MSFQNQKPSVQCFRTMESDTGLLGSGKQQPGPLVLHSSGFQLQLHLPLREAREELMTPWAAASAP